MVNRFKKKLSILQNANFYYDKENYAEAKLNFLKNPISELDNCSLERLANCFLRTNDIDNSLSIFEKLERRSYQKDNFFNSYGVALKEKKRFVSAIEKFYLGLKINKNNFLIYFNLANVFLENADFTKAKFNYLKCIKLNEEFYPARINLATIALKQGKVDNALRILVKLLHKRNKDVILLENIAKIYLLKQNYVKSEFFFKKLIELDNTKIKKVVAVLQGYTYQGKDKNYKKLAKFYTEKLTFESQIFKFSKNSKSKLKIGFLSPDIRIHPIGFFLKDVMPYLSKFFDISVFETGGYTDKISEYIKKFTRWFNYSNFDSHVIAEKIYKENVDILFDLSGFTNGNRMEVLKLKPSPIQISWAGWLSSTFLKQIDYIIGDYFAIRKNDSKNFSEKVLRMENIWCVYSKSELRNLKIGTKIFDQIVFGCCQRPEKINLAVLKAFSEILRRKSNSYLFFNNGIFQNYDKSKILSVLKKNGVDQSRIKFASSRERFHFLKSFNQIDINLDTFPYNGGTTNFESTYMGIPLLTMENQSNMFRCGESINYNLGMVDWISSDTENYIEKAIEFSNIKRLKIEKKKLLNRSHKSPLFDAKQFCSDFEKKISGL